MKELFVAAAMTLSLVGQQTELPAAPVQQTQTTTPTQAIPDGPRPQTPGLSSVAPGKGTTSTSNGTPDLPADPDQAPVGSTLPSTSQKPEPEQQTPPDLPAPGQGPAAFTLVRNVDFVEVPFTVKDNKGRLVPGITWRDVHVYENGLRQHMSTFTVDPFPLSVALVIDQSLPYDTMTRVNNALGALQGAFTAYDNVAVFTYSNGPKLQTDFTAGQSARLAAVVERSKVTGREPMYYAPGEALERGININSGAQDHTNPLTSGGPGSIQGVNQVQREVHTLNDAILEAAKATTAAGKGRRRIVYVISDGKEYGSKAKTKEVIRYLQMNKIAVYATLVGDSSVEGLGFLYGPHAHLPLMMRDNILPVYTKATGGETYAEYRTKGIETSFAKITEDVRTQYTVGFYSREPFIDGKYRKLEVKISRPNLQISAKEGYYPSASESHPAAVPQRPSPLSP